jgi:hypothetical protein
MLLWKKISKDDLVLTCGVAFWTFESIGFLYIHSKLSRQCLFGPTRYPKRVKKKDSASMSGKIPKFFTECKGGHF